MKEFINNMSETEQEGPVFTLYPNGLYYAVKDIKRDKVGAYLNLVNIIESQ